MMPDAPQRLDTLDYADRGVVVGDGGGEASAPPRATTRGSVGVQ